MMRAPTPHEIARQMVALPAHAGPYKSVLSLTANELCILQGSVDLSLRDYRARDLPRKTAYVARANRLMEKIDLAMADTQRMTTDLEKAIDLINAMPTSVRRTLLDLLDARFCPNCGDRDESQEHDQREELCLRVLEAAAESGADGSREDPSYPAE